MTVIVLTACPSGLRGRLTNWLLEISAGVFVGNVTAWVRSLLWARVVELSGNGRVLMVYSVRGEQRLPFKSMATIGNPSTTRASHWSVALSTIPSRQAH
jgi:CRISPR-associated protein Cas2